MLGVRKLFVYLCIVLMVLAAAGCVMRSDLDLVANSLDSRMRSLESELDGVRKTAESSNESNRFVRKKVADVDDNMTVLLTDVQKLRGATEDLSVKVASLQSSSGTRKDEELAGKVDDVLKRIERVENYLGMGEKKTAAAVPDRVLDQERASLQEEIDKEKEYSEALTIFKEGDYVNARKKFQEFLGAFADTEYSDNAQFWIGECYYFEGSFEKAILEYEKVVQNYPKGNKVPDALLKQAFSFLKLEDSSSAKLLFQRVIKDYPNTTSARRAREQLLSIK